MATIQGQPVASAVRELVPRLQQPIIITFGGPAFEKKGLMEGCFADRHLPSSAVKDPAQIDAMLQDIEGVSRCPLPPGAASRGLIDFPLGFVTADGLSFLAAEMLKRSTARRTLQATSTTGMARGRYSISGRRSSGTNMNFNNLPAINPGLFEAIFPHSTR